MNSKINTAAAQPRLHPKEEKKKEKIFLIFDF
jgi:hypothetical protein